MCPMGQDEALVHIVGQYPWLYDKSNENYKDQAMKRNSWREVATRVNMNEEQCRKRWQCLRDRYVRTRRVNERPLPSGSGAEAVPKKKWELYPLLDSLLHRVVDHCSHHQHCESRTEPTQHAPCCCHSSTLTGGNSFQLGAARSQHIETSSSSPSPISTPSSTPDLLDPTEILMIEEDSGSGPTALSSAVSGAGEKQTHKVLSARKKMHLEPQPWQVDLVKALSVNKQEVPGPAQAAGQYLTSALLSIQDPTEMAQAVTEIIAFINEKVYKTKAKV